MVQVARSVRAVSDEGGNVLGHAPQDGKDDVLYHFGSPEGVEAPVVHRRQAQPVVALQGNFPVRQQLASQVGD